MSCVICQELSLTIKKAVILRNIDLELAGGKIHGFVGRNGSGKTVLMKCICGLMLPTGGQVIVNGKRIGTDADFPESLGVILETPGFLPYCSGYENLRLLAQLKGKIGREEIRRAMETVDLDPDRKLHVKNYSLGMRQRLGLAQAIMEDPELLILDEPFNGLDQRGVDEMRALLRKLKERGKTILLSSHMAEDIKLLCDTVTTLDHGQIVGMD